MFVYLLFNHSGLAFHFFPLFKFCIQLSLCVPMKAFSKGTSHLYSLWRSGQEECDTTACKPAEEWAGRYPGVAATGSWTGEIATLGDMDQDWPWAWPTLFDPDSLW